MGDQGLPSHLESYLGTIKAGWKFDHFQVVEYGKPMFGGRAFSTLGLSRYALKSPVSNKDIKQELLMILPESVKTKDATTLLDRVGEQVLQHSVPLLRGDVVVSKGAVLPRTRMEGLYVAAPVYLPDEFASYSGREGKIAIAWLVPIASAEAALVNDKGWSAFEDVLANADPDLVDVRRPPIV